LPAIPNPIDQVESKRRHLYHRAVRGVFRFLICLALGASIAFAAVSPQPLNPEVQKSDGCAKMKAQSATYDCERHVPKPDPDKQCCTTCVLCLAAVLATTTSFVYPPVGDENFAAYISSERTRAQQPPVPPPRA